MGKTRTITEKIAREKDMFHLKKNEFTLSEIGSIYNLTGSRVQQLIAKYKLRLKHGLIETKENA